MAKEESPNSDSVKSIILAKYPFLEEQQPWLKEAVIEGTRIEFEHGLRDKLTNVTDSRLKTTMKIALAHITEFPNYYDRHIGLIAMEQRLNQSWEGLGRKKEKSEKSQVVLEFKERLYYAD